MGAIGSSGGDGQVDVALIKPAGILPFGALDT